MKDIHYLASTYADSDLIFTYYLDLLFTLPKGPQEEGKVSSF